MFINSQLREAFEDLARFRDSHDEESRYTHMTSATEGNFTNPSTLFKCPCLPEGDIARSLEPSRGGNITIVPYAQSFNWIKKFKKHHVPHLECAIRHVIVAHGDHQSHYPLRKEYHQDLDGKRTLPFPVANDRAMPIKDGTYLYEATANAHQYWILSTPDSFEPRCGMKVVEKRHWTMTSMKRQVREAHGQSTNHPESDWRHRWHR